MDKVLDMLRKAMQNARILALVQFDPALFLFTSALQAAIRKGEEYKNSRSRTASDRKEFEAQSRQLLAQYHIYLKGRRRI